MELGFDVTDVLPQNITAFRQEEISRLNYSLPRRYHSAYDSRRGAAIVHSRGEKIQLIIDRLGKKSAEAQSLGSSITSFLQMTIGNEQSIYILRENELVLGFIKVGYKPLFIMDQNGNQSETCPLCVLDFFVMEQYQRRGCGRRLFEFMLQDLSLHPAQLAIDRPSSKFKSFLRKHYNLVGSVPQINNFVIFDGFFRYNKPKTRRNRLTDDFREKRSRHVTYDGLMRANSWSRKSQGSSGSSISSRNSTISSQTTLPAIDKQNYPEPLGPREPKSSSLALRKMSDNVQNAHWRGIQVPQNCPIRRYRGSSVQRQNTTFNLFGIKSKHY